MLISNFASLSDPSSLMEKSEGRLLCLNRFVRLDSREFTRCAKCAQTEGPVTLKGQ